MTRIDGGNYDYHQAYSYVGNSGSRHYKYCLVYVPAGRSDSCNQYGYYAYNEQLTYFNMTTRSRDCNPSRSPFEWTDKDNGKKYILTASMCSGSHVWSWEELANMSIANLYADNTATPDSTEFITVDVVNNGGSGTFDLVLLDGAIEIDRIANKSIADNGSSRETLQFVMLNTAMTLTIQLIDNQTSAVIDERTHTVNLPDLCDGVICDPKCVGDDLYSQVCDSGICIKGVLIESDNAEVCGYVPPDPDPEPDPDPDPDPEPDGTPWDMIALAGIGVVILYLFMVRK